MHDVSNFASAPLPQDRFILWDDVTRVGWTQGSRIAFTGFADAAEAAWGAAIAAAAIARRRGGDVSGRASADSSNVALVSADGAIWVESDGRRLARMIPPGRRTANRRRARSAAVRFRNRLGYRRRRIDRDEHRAHRIPGAQGIWSAVGAVA
jgi:hypothetical protein